MKHKNSSWLASAAIILLLVIVGPAEAFDLSLDINNKSTVKGQIITFTAEINIKMGEHLSIDYLALTLSGPENQICEFYPDGRIKQGCKGLNGVERIGFPDYGYGYSYGSRLSGKLAYRITLDTADYLIGVYSTSLKIKTKSKESIEFGPQVQILAESLAGLGSSNRKRNSECSTNWTCTEWSVCDGNYQYRNCTLVDANCLTFSEKPATTRICNIRDIAGEDFSQYVSQVDKHNEEKGEEEGEEKHEKQNKTSPDSLARITGAVIGPFGIGLEDAFLVITGFLIIIGGLSTVLIIRKISLKRKFAYYAGEFN